MASRRPDLDQPRGDPARSCRRASSSSAVDRRVRAGPGLRPLRRAGDDRPVGRPADADRASAQLGGRAAGSTRRRRRPARRPGTAARAGAGPDGADVIDLDDGSTAEGHAILLAVGRSFPLDDLGLEHYGIDTSGRSALPPRWAAARRRRPVGDRRSGRARLHTHQAHYQGELAVRMAIGESVSPTTGRCHGRPTPTPRRRRSG